MLATLALPASRLPQRSSSLNCAMMYDLAALL
jgi:hypothetical protein